jgi:hypothetical protein
LNEEVKKSKIFTALFPLLGRFSNAAFADQRKLRGS